MEVSGYSYSFGGMLERVEVDHPVVIRYFRDMDVKAIEIYDPFVKDDMIPGMIDALGEAEMTISMYDVEYDVVSRDPAVRQDRTEGFHERLRAANRVGATKVLILPGDPTGDISREECHEWLNEAIAKSLPVAKELGITLTIANLGFAAKTYGSSDYILATCKAAEPDLKNTYDVGNFLMAKEDSIEALNKVFSETVHVHFKDWEIVPSERPGAFAGMDGRLYLGAPLGDGIVNLPGVVARLKELNYDGYLSVEYEGIEDPWKAVDRGITYLRTLL